MKNKKHLPLYGVGPIYVPILYWIFLTVLMKNTEEKWLLDLYGDEYVDYCKKVNRSIPFKRK